MPVSTPIVGALKKWTLEWTSSLTAADYRGITHQRTAIGVSSTSLMALFTGKRAEKAARNRWDPLISGIFRHRMLRGITHQGLGVSHTTLSGFQTPKHGVSPTKPQWKHLRSLRIQVHSRALTFLTIPI